MGKMPPKWMSKHPCTACKTGYGFCAQGLGYNKMCCKKCDHPTRWQPNPWTYGDVVEMWEGKSKPKMIQNLINDLHTKEFLERAIVVRSYEI